MLSKLRCLTPFTSSPSITYLSPLTSSFSSHLKSLLIPTFPASSPLSSFSSSLSSSYSLPSSSSPISLFSSSFSSTSSSKSTSHSLSTPLDSFARRHLGPSISHDVPQMLNFLNESSLESLIDKTIPAGIRSPSPLVTMNPPKGEFDALNDFRSLMSLNKVNQSHIGLGYYNTITPPVILRNVIENPAWYTPYTPYQAEIAQGRLEMLLNFQTMVTDLTGLPVSNSSLLDEGTAAAESINMTHGIQLSSKKRNTFLIGKNVHPQTIAVCQTRAAGIGVKILVEDPNHLSMDNDDVFGILLQYPDTFGDIHDYRSLTSSAKSKDIKVVVATDLLSLTLLTPPGEWGADIVCGSAQRFGVPLGFGGPHAAFLATTDQYKRKLPGRIIGVSKDSRGKLALRMAMQTREQHIRRDKATSNICTAQALLANTAASYGIYHGPEGLKEIATRCHELATAFAMSCTSIGVKVKSHNYFDTVWIETEGKSKKYMEAAWSAGINLRMVDNNNITVSFDETHQHRDVQHLIDIIAKVKGVSPVKVVSSLPNSSLHQLDKIFHRSSSYMTHPVFHSHHCETEMLRYLYRLQQKDLSLATAMIPLGSCTMKLNATSEMIPITFPTVNSIHPFAPADQVKGYEKMLEELKVWLAEITGFAGISLQPNAGSQGEYAGLLAIHNYHLSQGAKHRNICLIPTSAHGTNPASAVMAGMKVVVVKCKDDGEIDMDDFKAKISEHKSNLSSLMITYPSTHGVFEENIKEVIALIHQAGGLVYMDGANMNAQVGLCSPGGMGADVCHLNLHKTFCIPHGGGGPGMGPIGVVKKLLPFLPSHPFSFPFESPTSTGAVASAPFSSASILPISYMYIKMMGGEGLTMATKISILNANYMAKKLSSYFNILFTGKNGTCAHEFIIDLRSFKESANVTEEDVAKRLQDYNFHAPTMSWPVPGTLMIEPTESESLYEMDRFCDAMVAIRGEIQEIIEGKQSNKQNVLKMAPHTADTLLKDEWTMPYSREKAAYPLPYLKSNKFWPSVGRLDNVYGDRNVVCTCPPVSDYQ